MARTITYSLHDHDNGPDAYYREISSFADDWISRAVPQVEDLVNGFCEFQVKKTGNEHDPVSCLYELLVLAVLLHEHQVDDLGMTRFSQNLLHRLVIIQERLPWYEGIIKVMRGFIFRISINTKKHIQTGDVFDNLLAWLNGSGEETIAARLIVWMDYFHNRNDHNQAILRLEKLASDFAADSLARLGKYTLNVDQFLIDVAPRHRWRYDSVLLSRSRLEYHLGMLGTELLNRSNRKAFKETGHKIVILPPCMRAQAEDQCKAQLTESGSKCTGCTVTCRIHQVTKLGEKKGFSVFMIPDDLRVLGGSGDERSVGIVGVSCVLTNWTGGWDAEKMDIRAQGLLLDYVGCKFHWDKTGFPTDINIGELLKILNIRR